MQVKDSDLKHIKNINFEQTLSINDVKKVLESSGKNVLLYLNWTLKQPRILSEDHEQVVPTPTNEEPEQRSQLF